MALTFGPKVCLCSVKSVDQMLESFKVKADDLIAMPPVDLLLHILCGGTVVRAPALESQCCEFDSHWVSTLATLGKLLT